MLAQQLLDVPHLNEIPLGALFCALPACTKTIAATQSGGYTGNPDVQAFIEEIKATHDATILLTTHDLAEADRLCDRLSILDRGRLVVEGTPDELKDKVLLEHDLPPTLESVFMTWTGRSLDDDVEDEEPEDAQPHLASQPAVPTDTTAGSPR